MTILFALIRGCQAIISCIACGQKPQVITGEIVPTSIKILVGTEGYNFIGFRGLSTKELADQYNDGVFPVTKQYRGESMYGDGIYITDYIGIAEQYGSYTCLMFLNDDVESNPAIKFGLVQSGSGGWDHGLAIGRAYPDYILIADYPPCTAQQIRFPIVNDMPKNLLKAFCYPKGSKKKDFDKFAKFSYKTRKNFFQGKKFEIITNPK